MRPDLIATLQAIAQQQTSPQAEWEKSHEIARSAACDKVFMALSPEAGPSVLRESSLVNSALKGLAFSVKDLFDVAGQATLAGSKVLKGVPVAHAAVSYTHLTLPTKRIV